MDMKERMSNAMEGCSDGNVVTMERDQHGDLVVLLDNGRRFRTSRPGEGDMDLESWWEERPPVPGTDAASHYRKNRLSGPGAGPSS